MKSLQDYINTYRTVASKLNIVGDSAEILIQLLANASYINEIENIAYANEASLEKSTMINSKIQHCMDDMYSVYRGNCPRVIIKFRPTKQRTFNLYDEILTANKFSIYYLGYLDTAVEESNTDIKIEDSTKTAAEEGFRKAPVTISPTLKGDTFTIIGLLAPSTSKKSWVLNKNNTYFVDCVDEDLSNDLIVKIGSDSELRSFSITRQFTDHIVNGCIFDLTIPGFGSRLYVADIFRQFYNKEENITDSNVKIDALYFKYSQLSNYNESEMKRITLKDAELVSFDKEFLETRGLTELAKGLCYIPETSRHDINTIHYKANRDRYVNSVFRSNTDIGSILEEMYPNKVFTNGTSYKFYSSNQGNGLYLYYVPIDEMNLLTTDEILQFVNTRSAYYITDQINVVKGSKVNVIFNLDLELYRNAAVDTEINEILSSFSNQFNIDLDRNLEGIKSLISKISNVKRINRINISYITDSEEEFNESAVEELKENLDITYYKIDYIINSTISTNN